MASIQEDNCPRCHQPLDTATEAGGSGRSPQPGNFSICCNCVEVNKFGPDMKLVKVEEAEIATLPEFAQRALREAQLKLCVMKLYRNKL